MEQYKCNSTINIIANFIYEFETINFYGNIICINILQRKRTIIYMFLCNRDFWLLINVSIYRKNND